MKHNKYQSALLMGIQKGNQYRLVQNVLHIMLFAIYSLTIDAARSYTFKKISKES